MIIPKLTEIFTFEHLLYSYHKCRKGKRNKNDVIRFETCLAKNLQRIEYTFKKGKYPPISYYNFIIHEPKEREVWATPFETRVIQTCFCEFFLVDYFEQFYYEESSACRKEKGISHAINIIKKSLHEYWSIYHTNKGWYLKIDIKQFFASIDHDKLKEMLKIMPECEVKDYLFYIIDSYKGPGLPLGNRTSQLLALFYLTMIDEYIKDVYLMKAYSRYADDLIIISHSKEILVCLLDDITVITANIKLKLNKKTGIFRLEKGLKYVGWKFKLMTNGKLIMRELPQNRHRTVRKYKEAIYYRENNKIGNKEYAARIQAVNAHLMKGNMYDIRCKLENLQYKTIKRINAVEDTRNRRKPG